MSLLGAALGCGVCPHEAYASVIIADREVKTCRGDLESPELFVAGDLKIYRSMVFWRGSRTLADDAESTVDARKLLFYLVANKGRRIERRTLTAALWPGQRSGRTQFTKTRLNNTLARLGDALLAVDPSFSMIHQIADEFVVWAESLPPEQTLLAHGELLVSDRGVFWKNGWIEELEARLATRHIRKFLMLLAGRPNSPQKSEEIFVALWPGDAHLSHFQKRNRVSDFERNLRRIFLKHDPGFDAVFGHPSTGLFWLDRTAIDDLPRGPTLSFNRAKQSFRYDHMNVTLTPVHRRLLIFLLRHSFEFFSGVALVGISRGEGVSDEASEREQTTLAVQMSYLKRAFLDLDPEFHSLQSRLGRGYAWIGPVPPELLGTPTPEWIGRGLMYDPVRKALVKDDSVLDVEPSLVGALRALAKFNGATLTPGHLLEFMRQQAERAVRPTNVVFSVRVQICKLRKLLKQLDVGVTIRTVHGYGYRLAVNN